MRTFETGATRDSDDGKLDYEGFLSPLALERYAKYMHKHRKQADGQMRDSDNWQKGIPREAYMKSLWRHMFDVWCIHRDVDDRTVPLDEALCAVIFNAMGMLHEHEKTLLDLGISPDQRPETHAEQGQCEGREDPEDGCDNCEWQQPGCSLGLSPDICEGKGV